jgi:excisionase family DNA binding protein
MNSITTDNSVARESAWMTPRQAATYLGVGVNTIYDACTAGGLKHVKLGHRTIRLRRAWVDAWVERLAEVHD